MKIFILYATYSGGTKAAAEGLQKNLESQGHAVTLQSILNTSPQGLYELNADEILSKITSSQLVIFASCTWYENGQEGQMNSSFSMFDAALGSKTFANVPSAVFGLGDSNYAQFCGAVDNLELFVKRRHIFGFGTINIIFTPGGVAVLRQSAKIRVDRESLDAIWLIDDPVFVFLKKCRHDVVPDRGGAGDS